MAKEQNFTPINPSAIHSQPNYRTVSLSGTLNVRYTSTRASGESVTVKLSPVASFRVPCHQAVNIMSLIGQRRPDADSVPEGERENRDTCMPGRLMSVAVFTLPL